MRFGQLQYHQAMVAQVQFLDSAIKYLLLQADILPQVVAQISLGRPGLPCDIGHAAAFLASDEARYITGQSLYVDGGWVGK